MKDTLTAEEVAPNSLRYGWSSYQLSTADIPSAEGLYIVRFKTGIKVGRSENLSRRINDYSKPWHLPILDVFWVSGCDSKELEPRVLSECRKKWGNPEGSTEYFSTLRKSHFDIACRILIRVTEDDQASKTVKINTNKINTN